MVRSKLCLTWVLLAGAFFVPHAFGASPAAEVGGQIKLAIKEQLANLKVSMASDLDNFETNMNVLLSDINDGTLPSMSTVVTAVAADYASAVNDVADSQQTAVFDLLADASAACNTAGIPPPPGFRNGDGGTLDKFKASVEKSNEKLRKKMLAKIKSVRDALRKASSSSNDLIAILRPITFPFQGSYNQTSAFPIVANEVVLLCLVSGSDSSSSTAGVVGVSGLSQGSNVKVDLVNVTANVATPVNGEWSTSFTGVNVNGTQLVRISENIGGDFISTEAIGMPPLTGP
ncbi:MAG: hypothetical protein L6R28_13810 [Planctomycetes bacterium]|nr:hypothetical protein [Planctomycetota bacterium]